MAEPLEAFKAHVIEAASDVNFVHHEWFVHWHLEIVAKIADELAEHYPEADRDLVELMAWLHDYGKILDFDNQYEVTLSAGPKKLVECGFAPEYAQKAADYIGILDRKMELDIHQAPIEVQIVSSADGMSHLVGPFMALWLYDHPTEPFEDLMAGNRGKALKDWNRKIVLPEARRAAEIHFKITMQQNGELPTSFLKPPQED